MASMECHFVFFCLLIAVPSVVGLQCYECYGRANGENPEDCVDAFACNMSLTDCNQPTNGKYFCSKVTTIDNSMDTPVTQVVRGCYEGTTYTWDGCTELSGSVAGIIAEVETCHCDTDRCNSQTKLAPAIGVVLASRFLAMYTTSC